MLRHSVAASLLLLLAACNTAPPAPPPQAGVVSNVTPSTFSMPGGSGCAGEAARFQAVMDNDLQTGNVAKSVHDRVTAEIAQARSACAAGDESGALARIAATKSKFGYR